MGAWSGIGREREITKSISELGTSNIEDPKEFLEQLRRKHSLSPLDFAFFISTFNKLIREGEFRFDSNEKTATKKVKEEGILG